MKLSKLTLILILFSSYSFAETPYLNAEFGISTASDAKVGLTGYTDSEIEYDSAIGFGLSAGLELKEGRKLGILFTSQENEGTIKQIDSSLVSLGLSSVVDLKVNTLGVIFTDEVPSDDALDYTINAGLGLAFAEIETTLISLEDTVFYFNFGGGASYSFSDSLSVYAKYNYFFMGDAEESTDINILGSLVEVKAETELGMHQFMFGISRSL